MVNLAGKGMYLWQLSTKDNPQMIAARCHAAGFTHLTIKIADYNYAYNVTQDGVDLVPGLIDELHRYGVQAWGWVFVYGNHPDAEAEIAIKRAQELEIDGLIINAECAYKVGDKRKAAARYMTQVRGAVGGVMPLALSSYRYPSLHPEFPWQEFLSQVDINMPQVYWVLARNAGAQLERCLAEFRQAKYPQRPVFPTGAAYSESGWKPTPEQVLAFMETAVSLGLPGCNFWEWRHAMDRFPELREVISAFEWPGVELPDVVTPDDGPPDAVDVPVEERLDRVEGDLDRVMDWIVTQDPEAFDA